VVFGRLCLCAGSSGFAAVCDVRMQTGGVRGLMCRATARVLALERCRTGVFRLAHIGSRYAPRHPAPLMIQTTHVREGLAAFRFDGVSPEPGGSEGRDRRNRVAHAIESRPAARSAVGMDVSSRCVFLVVIYPAFIYPCTASTQISCPLQLLSNRVSLAHLARSGIPFELPPWTLSSTN
jgi:hypothetical protein